MLVYGAGSVAVNVDQLRRACAELATRWLTEGDNTGRAWTIFDSGRPTATRWRAYAAARSNEMVVCGGRTEREAVRRLHTRLASLLRARMAADAAALRRWGR